MIKHSSSEVDVKVQKNNYNTCEIKIHSEEMSRSFKGRCGELDKILK